MLNVNITIQADAEGAFTAKEQDVLNALAGAATQTTQTTQVDEVKVTEPAPEEAAPAKPKRTRRPKAEIEAEKAAKEAAEADEEEPKTLQEELAEDGDDDEDLRAKVVKLAGEMVSSGNPAGVRSALQSVGAKKVSEVKDKDLQDLFDALELNN